MATSISFASIFLFLSFLSFCEVIFILSVASKPEKSGLFSLLANCCYEFQAYELLTRHGIWLQEYDSVSRLVGVHFLGFS